MFLQIVCVCTCAHPYTYKPSRDGVGHALDRWLAVKSTKAIECSNRGSDLVFQHLKFAK